MFGRGRYLYAGNSKDDLKVWTDTAVNKKQWHFKFPDFHDSWEEAHNFLIRMAESDLERCRERCHDAQEWLEQVEKMSKPE